MGQIVGWYVGSLFRRNPNIDIPEGADKWYSDTFLENCDRAGHSYNDFFRDGNAAFLQKPYTHVTLAKAVRDCLDK